MKITYDGQIFGWQRFGGISRIYFELIKYINQLEGVDVNVVGKFFISEYLKNSSLDNMKNAVYIPDNIKIPGRILQFLNRPFFERKKLDCDIYHETYFDSYEVSIPKKTHRILTVYDMIHEKYPEEFSFFNNTQKSKEESVSRADHIICISESTKRDLINILDVPKNKISVVYLGHELTTDSRLYLDSPNKENFLLYVGKRGGYKNFECLLKSLSLSKDLKNNFTVVAFGGGAFSTFEKNQLKKYGVKAKQVSGNDNHLINLYRKAKIFIYPSLYEGFGIPPLEAMVLGCPVICSNKSSIPEVVGEAGIYFDPYDPSDLLKAINNLLRSKELEKEFISRGRKRASKFTWKECCSKTLEVYKRVVS